MRHPIESLKAYIYIYIYRALRKILKRVYIYIYMYGYIYIYRAQIPSFPTKNQRGLEPRHVHMHRQDDAVARHVPGVPGRDRREHILPLKRLRGSLTLNPKP